MLTEFKHTIDLLEAFNWESELKNIVVSNRDKIEDLQREQMAAGKDSEGNPTTLEGNGYAASTIAYKRMVGVGLGAVTDRVTGYQSGELYRQLEAQVVGNEFILESKVGYFDELKSRTGDQWMGLMLLQREKFADQVTLPLIKESFKEKTGFIITSR